MYVQCERKEEGEGLGMRLLHRTEIHLHTKCLVAMVSEFKKKMKKMNDRQI